ncbi:MAG: FtsX-like permease family protein, partial [Acidobacteria bacterium]|nr:FtsX-like permease family protein [Acidobacteriota bacterium]
AFVLFAYLAAIRLAFGTGVSVAGADRMLVIHKVSLIQPLPESYLGRIAAVDGVADISHMSWFGGIYQDPRNFFAQFAVDPESYLRLYPEIVLSDEEREAWLRNRTGAIVGRVTADRFGFEVGDRIPLQGTIFRTRSGPTWEFTIDGIYEAGAEGYDTSTFYFHHEYLMEANDQGARFIGQYIIRVDDPARSADVAAAIDTRFANSPAETRTSTEQAFLQGFADQIGNIGAIVTAILGAVFFTILVITANTMAQSIRERTNELAVLKTLGFTDRRVLALVLIESLALAVVGGAVGLGVGWLLIGLGDPTGGFLTVFLIPTRDLVLGGVLIVLLGFAAGAVPALLATRLRIVDALRKV